jgi:hypothetical protein
MTRPGQGRQPNPEKGNELRREYGGQRVTIDTAAVTEKVRHNRARHQRVYTAALGGYVKDTRRKLLAEARLLLREHVPHSVRLNVYPPADHTRDYDRVLAMLEMHTDPTITMDERTFAQFVLDDWDWKEEWLATANTYAVDFVETEYGDS